MNSIYRTRHDGLQKQMSNGCLKGSSQRLFKLGKEVDPKYSDPKYSGDPKCNSKLLIMTHC